MSTSTRSFTPSSSTSTLTHDDVGGGWAAVRKALMLAYFGPILLLIAACAVILLFAPPAEAQERPNHSPERLELIRRLQEQDRFLSEETSRILGELASHDQFSFWTARQAIAWVRSQQPLVERIEEITQERRRNLSALYCTEFDRKNSLGLYELWQFEDDFSGLRPSPSLTDRENVTMFFVFVEVIRIRAMDASSATYHAYVVIEAFGSDCSDGS